MTIATRSPTEADLQEHWGRLVRWVAFTLAVNLVCGLLFVTVATRSTSNQLSNAERKIETSRSNAGGSCRVIAGTKIKSL